MIKRNLLLLAGLSAGLVCLGTVLVADDPALTLADDPVLAAEAEATGFILRPTYICHYPPGQNGRSRGKEPKSGKWNIVVVDPADFLLPPEECQRTEADISTEERAETTDAHHMDAAPEAAGIISECFDLDAYFDEIDGHIRNHGDCIISSPSAECPAFGEALSEFCFESPDVADFDDE